MFYPNKDSTQSIFKISILFYSLQRNDNFYMFYMLFLFFASINTNIVSILKRIYKELLNISKKFGEKKSSDLVPSTASRVES